MSIIAKKEYDKCGKDETGKEIFDSLCLNYEGNKQSRRIQRLCIGKTIQTLQDGGRRDY